MASLLEENKARSSSLWSDALKNFVFETAKARIALWTPSCSRCQVTAGKEEQEKLGSDLPPPVKGGRQKIGTQLRKCAVDSDHEQKIYHRSLFYGNTQYHVLEHTDLLTTRFWECGVLSEQQSTFPGNTQSSLSTA